MKPVIVLAGRPNVGKSTLFNRLTGGRTALVADLPGMTRDRLYGNGRVGDRPYVVVDTGGIVEPLPPRGHPPRKGTDLTLQIEAQIKHAMNEADAIIFLTDARTGLIPQDSEIAQRLRYLQTPVWVAVNKAEGMNPEIAAAEFHALGLGKPHAVSAAHGEGVASLMHDVLAGLARAEETDIPRDTPRVAVVGRPNAGKSTLINALLGEDRVIVCDEPGTTRDSVQIPMQRAGKSYVLIDTAGVRRKSRVRDAVEKFSVIKSLQSIDQANVVILVVDAGIGIGEHDAALAGYILEAGRSLVLVVNKWDTLDAAGRQWVRRELERKLRFLDFAPPQYVSALHGKGVPALFGAIERAFNSANRTLSTGKLNRTLQQALQNRPAPVVRGRRIKLKYAHQGGKNPPQIIIHGNLVRAVPVSYRRYLANRFREAFRLTGAPVRVEFREAENPFSEAKRKSARKRGGRRS